MEIVDEVYAHGIINYAYTPTLCSEDVLGHLFLLAFGGLARDLSDFIFSTPLRHLFM